MDVINNFISENKDILSILITLLVGFIAWICKELIKTPMRQSRETFFKVTEKRIGILSELYNYINIIALFPQETNIKEELQKIILSDKLAYVDEKIIVNIIEIAFKEVTNERLVLDTRKELRETIDKCAEIIRKENQYFLKHDTTNTYKRVIAYFIQLIKAISFIVFILIAIFYLIKSIVFLSVVWIIFCCIFIFAVMLILEKYLKSATKPLNVLIAFTRPLITEFADNLNLKHPLLPTISPYPTM